MIRYSIQEIKTAIGALKDLRDVVFFQRSMLAIAFCYSENELADISIRIDLRILTLKQSK